jgi:hypothetical protein
VQLPWAGPWVADWLVLPTSFDGPLMQSERRRKKPKKYRPQKVCGASWCEESEEQINKLKSKLQLCAVVNVCVLH